MITCRRCRPSSGTWGLAGNIARLFIDSPLTPLLMMATLAVCLIGLYVTPRQEDRQISVLRVDRPPVRQ